MIGGGREGQVFGQPARSHQSYQSILVTYFFELSQTLNDTRILFNPISETGLWPPIPLFMRFCNSESD